MNVIIWGGTGQCKAIVPILEYNNKNIVAIFDNTQNMVSPFNNIPLYHDSFFEQWLEKNICDKVVVAIGNPHGKIREKIYKHLETKNIFAINIAHKHANISTLAHLSIGYQILSNSNIREFAKIGKYCIVNCNSLIEHDVVLSDCVEIGPGAVVCGEVFIDKYTWIGANATILPRLQIGKNCIVGAGAVVTKNIPDNTIVIGNPAKKLKII